jgi:multiple antibiotic resistance protein
MLGPSEIFTIFFITLGPLKILGPFAQRTHGVDDATVRQIAVRAFLIASISAIAGGFLGSALHANWRISIGVAIKNKTMKPTSTENLRPHKTVLHL